MGVSLGVGEELFCETKALQGSIYRERITVAAVVRGSVDQVLRDITSRSVSHSVAALVFTLYYLSCLYQFFCTS